MRRKLCKVMALVIMSCVLFSAVPTFAAPGGDYGPDKDFKIQAQLNTSIQIKADNDKNYMLDDKRAFFNMNPMADMGNGLFYFYKLLVKSNIDIMIKAYKFDIYKKMSTFIDTLLLPIKKTIFDSMASVAIAIAILFIVVAFLGRSSTTGGNQALTFVFIMIFSLVFLAYPAKTLDAGRNLMTAVSNNLIKNSFQNTYKAATIDDALAILANRQWEVMVERPWRMLEFDGDVAMQSKYESQLLATPPGDSRQAITDEMRDQSPANTAAWFGNIFFMIPLIIFTLLPILALSSIMIASSALVLASTVLSPLIFCISYIPVFSRSFFTWLSRLLGFLGITVTATIGITFLLNLLDIQFTALKDQNIVAILMVNALVITVLFLMRDKLFGIVTSPMFGQRAFDRSLREKSDVLERGKRDHRSMSDVMDKIKSFEGTADQENSAPKAHKKSFNHSNEKSRQRPDKDKPASGSHSDPSKPETQNQTKAPEGHVSINLDLQERPWSETEFRKGSKEFLNARFTHEKDKEDYRVRELRAKTGDDIQPEYSSYVKNRLARQEKGLFEPSPAEMMEATNRMRAYERSGKSPLGIYEELREDFDEDTMGPNSKTQNTHRNLNEDYARQQFRKQAGVSFDFTADATDRDLAQSYLRAQFKMNQTQANEKAKEQALKTGEPAKPVYDEFVNQGIRRMREGHQIHSGAEIDRAEAAMSDMRRRGLDPRRHLETMGPEDMKDYVGLKEQTKVSVKDVKKTDVGQGMNAGELKQVVKQAAKEAVSEAAAKKGGLGAHETKQNTHDRHGHTVNDHLEDITDKIDRMSEEQERMREQVRQKPKSQIPGISGGGEGDE